MTVRGTLALARPEQPASQREARVAVATAGGLYAVGGLLCASAVLLPHVSSAAGVIAVGLDALLSAGLLLFAASREWGGIGLACAAELWGVAVIGVLCASSGGADSPFALIYFFALGHAAAFQPRARFAAIATATLIAFLAPLLYEHVSTMFAAVACVGVVLALLASMVVHAALNRLRLQRRRLEILIAATARLDQSLDPTETLRTIADTAVPNLAELCVIDLLDPHGSIGATVAAAIDPTVAAGVERMREEFPLDMGSDHPVAQVLSGSAPRIIRDLTETGAIERAAQSAEHERFMRAAGYARAAVFPMIARGRTLGAISFLQLHGDAQHDLSLLAILEDLAGRAAMAFDNARLYAERAQIARTLRRSLMPAVLPQVPGLQLASYFRPSDTGSEVGGDFYDVFGGPESCWLVVGDVCGKGAEAAALTAFLRHTTAAYAREARSPASVLCQVNRAMLDHDAFDGRFATAILARIRSNGSHCEVTVALAGHPAALVVRADGEDAHELGDRGALLGVFPEPSIGECTAILTPGDGLALYTDGLPDAHAPVDPVPVQRMIDQLQSTRQSCAEDTISALLALIDPDDNVRDDIAILAAKVRPSRHVMIAADIRE